MGREYCLALPPLRSQYCLVMKALGEAERELVADHGWQRAQSQLTYQHAQWCRDWAVRLGHPGGEISPRGERSIAFRGATEEQNGLLRIVLCCMNETVGCVVLRHARPVIELRELNRRHMSDELQRRRGGSAQIVPGFSHLGLGKAA